MGNFSLIAALSIATAVTGFISESQTIPKSPGFQQSIQQVDSVATEVQGSDMLKTIVPLLQSLRERRNPQPYSPVPQVPT